SPDFQGKAAIREAIGGMMQDPNFALSFETTQVEVARSGDFAYERGTYTITTTDPKTKKPVIENGSGLVLWQKQQDGTWKVLVDAPVSDPAS
ncbi:MAG: YybH family protein, partial [Candidatus Acidiferrales bacterium]